jgi:hypothetical protein
VFLTEPFELLSTRNAEEPDKWVHLIHWGINFLSRFKVWLLSLVVEKDCSASRMYENIYVTLGWVKSMFYGMLGERDDLGKRNVAIAY